MQLPPVLSPLDRPGALFILLALLSVFVPVLVLLAVGHVALSGYEGPQAIPATLRCLGPSAPSGETRRTCLSER
jgi:hypothetical protein